MKSKVLFLGLTAVFTAMTLPPLMGEETEAVTEVRKSAWEHHEVWDPDHEYPIDMSDFYDKWADSFNANPE